MALKQGDLGLLKSDVARRLLSSRIPARFAYVAADAQVDQKLIAHFFGSKQQLFVATVGLPFNPGDVLPAVLAGDRDTVGTRLAELLISVLETPGLHRRLTSVVRAAAAEPEVARMLREFLTRELFTPAAQLLGGGDGPFRANLVGSQIVGIVMPGTSSESSHSPRCRPKRSPPRSPRPSSATSSGRWPRGTSRETQGSRPRSRIDESQSRLEAAATAVASAAP